MRFKISIALDNKQKIFITYKYNLVDAINASILYTKSRTNAVEIEVEYFK